MKQFAVIILGATKRTLTAQGHTYDLLNFTRHQLGDLGKMLCDAVDIKGDDKPLDAHKYKRRHKHTAKQRRHTHNHIQQPVI